MMVMVAHDHDHDDGLDDRYVLHRIVRRKPQLSDPLPPYPTTSPTALEYTHLTNPLPNVSISHSYIFASS
jgi:hypothetical protein